MGSLQLKELSKLGYTNDRVRSLVINTLSKHFKHHQKEELIEMLTSIINTPEHYLQDPVLGKIAGQFVTESQAQSFAAFSLLDQPRTLKIYGGKQIEQGAKRQMELAMSLPVTVQGALMPDAHTGFGLPIGGVLATDQVVIPYAVGVDIGCRMALTILDESESYLKRYGYQVKTALKEHTHFGMEGGLDGRQEHEVLDSPLFGSTELLKRLQGKAAKQLGSSGSGNHFVEFGEIELFADNSLHLSAGKYLALLSHSGSRGLGANIAQHYTKIAMDTCKLPAEAQQLAWLDIRSDAGEQYWLAMNLAGDYARACHDTIRTNLLQALGLQALATVENHHNFAWQDTLADGRRVITHRKGATPAHRGELGIIPGSMSTAAYLVAGKGREQALYSASHGAGRSMSRQRAKESTTVSDMKKELAHAGITLIGGSLEESPVAYKDIETVMSLQQDLVQVEGKFLPRIVRMNKE